MSGGLDEIADLGNGARDGTLASQYVLGGEILVGKLVSTLLGAVWLTVVAGWITVSQAIVTVHLRVIDAIAQLYVRVIKAFGQGGAETIRASWRSAFLAAVETNELLAPLLLTTEVVVVSALLLWARRRWT